MKSASMTIPSPNGRSPLGTLPDCGAKVPLPDMETCRNHLLRFSREIAVPRGTKLEAPNAAGWRPVLIDGAIYWVSREATRRYDGGEVRGNA